MPRFGLTFLIHFIVVLPMCQRFFSFERDPVAEELAECCVNLLTFYLVILLFFFIVRDLGQAERRSL